MRFGCLSFTRARNRTRPRVRVYSIYYIFNYARTRARVILYRACIVLFIYYTLRALPYRVRVRAIYYLLGLLLDRSVNQSPCAPVKRAKITCAKKILNSQTDGCGGWKVDGAKRGLAPRPTKNLSLNMRFRYPIIQLFYCLFYCLSFSTGELF